jgi:hypothetical protein
MAMRSQIVRLLLALGCAAAAVGVPIVTAAPAAACPVGMNSDPYTGQCYTQNSIPTVNGIPCIPGQHLGTCLGFLQNMPVPSRPNATLGP